MSAEPGQHEAAGRPDDYRQLAFTGNKATSITIPASVATIGIQAFTGSNNLLDVYFMRMTAPAVAGTAPQLNQTFYRGSGALTPRTHVNYRTGATGYVGTTPGRWPGALENDTFTFGAPTITASAGSNGSISPSGVQTLSPGDNATYTFAPAPGFRVATLTVNGSAVLPATSPYTFTNVAADSAQTIAVTYEFDALPAVSTPASSTWSLILASLAALGAAVVIQTRRGVGRS